MLCTGCHMLCLTNLHVHAVYCLNCYLCIPYNHYHDEYDEIMRSKMGVIKSKMGTIGSKMSRNLKSKTKKANLVKAYPKCCTIYKEALANKVFVGCLQKHQFMHLCNWKHVIIPSQRPLVENDAKWREDIEVKQGLHVPTIFTCIVYIVICMNWTEKQLVEVYSL